MGTARVLMPHLFCRFAIYLWTKECLQRNYFAISTRRFIVLSQAKELKCWCTKTIWIENHSHGTNAFISWTHSIFFILHSSLSLHSKWSYFEMLNKWMALSALFLPHWIEISSIVSNGNAHSLDRKSGFAFYHLLGSYRKIRNRKFVDDSRQYLSYLNIVLFGPDTIRYHVNWTLF